MSEAPEAPFFSPMPDPDVCPSCGTPGKTATLCVACLLELAVSRTDPPNLDGNAFGKYTIKRVLGEGGMGIVYEAHDDELDRTVALKMLTDDFDAPEVLMREAKIVASIEHEHIVPIYDAGEYEGIAYFTMRRIDGGQLETPAPTAHRAAEIALAISKAIDFAHDHRILHLDLKPANVLVDQSGKPYVTDFGVAIREGHAPGETVSPGGTPLYMAPEVWRGDPGAATCAADIWGVGALLYEMLAGRPPFLGNTKEELMEQVLTAKPPNLPGVAAELVRIYLRCLEKEPTRRYSTAKELIAEIEGYLEGVRSARAPHSRDSQLLEGIRDALWFIAVVIVMLGLYAAVVAIQSGVQPDATDKRSDNQIATENETTTESPTSAPAANPWVDPLTKQMETVFRRHAALVEKGSLRRDVVEALSNPRNGEAAEVCARLQQQSWPDAAWFLLDTQGKLVGRAPEIADPDADQPFTYRDYYRGADDLEKKGIRSAYISRAYRSKFDDDYKIAFSIMVHDHAQNRVGMLVATLPTGSRALNESILLPEESAKNLEVSIISPRDPYDSNGQMKPGATPVFLVQRGLERGQELSFEPRLNGERRFTITTNRIPGTTFTLEIRVYGPGLFGSNRLPKL